MNKYFIIVGVLVLIVAVGVGYNTFLVNDADRPMETGVVRNITITARENRWEFDPPYFEVDQGDRIMLTVVNEDRYDHGFAIDAFGVSQRLPAGETIVIDFVATKAGEFPYYCSVSCGAGLVDGIERGHFDQIGKFVVKSLASGPQTPIPSPALPNASSPEPRQPAPSAPQQDSAPIEEETEKLPDDIIIDTETAFMAIASMKARELGYNPDRLFAKVDTDNGRWESYHSSIGNVLTKDPAFAFLEQDNYAAVYFTATTNVTTPYLWIFIDATSGEVLHYYEP